MTTFNDTIAETVGVSLTQALTQYYAVTSFEGVRAFDFIAPGYTQPALATDQVNFTEALVPTRGVVITESLLIGLAEIDNWKSQLSLAENIGTLDQLLVAIPAALADTITVSPVLLAQQAVEVIEQLNLVDVISPMFKYTKTLAETINLATSLVNFFGAEVNDIINVSDVMVSVALHNALATETLTVIDVPTTQLLFRVTVDDVVSLDDVDVLQMIYSGVITEGLQINVGYLSPGEGIVTWAMNTRTGAVTEYDNYAFNSFAQLGDLYIGASDTGLYKLVGDDDAGTDIVAHIKSGFAQWAGTKFAMFKGIYLGVRSEGDFILKLITGDDKTYIYTVNAQKMMSTRIRTGKGLRARYFAFELISTGQDFDLDTIEFVPLVSNRRV